jgi:hypothetical protein
MMSPDNSATCHDIALTAMSFHAVIRIVVVQTQADCLATDNDGTPLQKKTWQQFTASLVYELPLSMLTGCLSGLEFTIDLPHY